MVEKEPRNITTLNEFLEWTAQFTDEEYLFRGVKDEGYRIQASASRRLTEAHRHNPHRLLKITEQLIEDAKGRGHDEKDGRTLWDLELLAKLQHFGAATCLIDFTRSALVALWFACENGTEDENGADGKVVAVCRDISLKTVTSSLINKPIDHFFRADRETPYQLYQWEPKLQNNRIIAQHSVFLFGGAEIEVEAKCVILAGSKRLILRSLNEASDINEATMYPDFDGFAQLHAHDKRYDEPDARGYLRRGLQADRRGDYCDAIRNYTSVISSDLVDGFIVTQAYYNSGVAYAKLGDLPSAVVSYTEAISRDSYFTEAYFNRGAAHAKMDNYVPAIEDFTKAINLKPTDATIYHTRAITFQRIGEINCAIEDYSKAIDLKPDFAESHAGRGVARLPLREWEQVGTDLTNAKNMGMDIITAFQFFYESVPDFEDKHKVKLPADIAAMLTPPQA